MSQRSYQAFIKAIRKRHGGLSLPAARKAAKVAAVRLGRPVRGIDVKQHPRIVKEAVPKAAGGVKPSKAGLRARRAVESAERKKVKVREAKRGREPGRKQPPKKGAEPKAPAAPRRITSIAEFESLEGIAAEEVEYVSTAEYRKGKG